VPLTIRTCCETLRDDPRGSQMDTRGRSVCRDSARYRGDYLFSTEMVENRSPRSSCSAPARARCGGRKDEGFSLSDEHKLDPLRPLPHFRLIHRSS
jgi:hypothetical protein